MAVNGDYRLLRHQSGHARMAVLGVTADVITTERLGLLITHCGPDLVGLLQCTIVLLLRCFDLWSSQGHEKDASGPSVLHGPAGVIMVSGVSVW